MLPQRNVQVDADWAALFESALREITVAGAPLRYRRADNGFFSMDWGHPNLHDQADAVRVAGVIRAPAELGLHSVEIEERSDTTAYHVPQGVLAIYDPLDQSVKSQERPNVSVLDIAPTILSTFGVAVPDYMNEPAGLAMNMVANHPALFAP